MSINLTAQSSNITFQRLFMVDNSPQLDIDWQAGEYMALLNWGIFKDENDTSPDFIYGA